MSQSPVIGYRSPLDHSATRSEQTEWRFPISLRAMLVGLVLIGSFLRVAQYLADRSYWHDEAALLMNILQKDTRALTGALDYGQASPPLFLWIERGLYVQFGDGEFIMRAVPLAASIIALALFAALSNRVLSPTATVLATAFFAFADKLIWHASEVKQYSGDTMVAVLLLYLAVGARRPLCAMARFGLISIVAAIAVWFSHPAAIIFGAVSLMMLPRMLGKGWVSAWVWAGGSMIVVASFGLLFHFSIAPTSRIDPELSAFWAEHFIDWKHPISIPSWFLRETYGLCDHPYQSFGALVMVLAVSGAIAFGRDRKSLLAVCLIPFALTLAAAGAHEFPYTGDRVTLYLTPGLLLMAAAGFDWLRVQLPDQQRIWLWLLFPIPLLLGGIIPAGYHVVVPRSRSHIRPVVEYLKAHRQGGEAMYVFSEGPERGRPDIHGGLGWELFCYWQNPPPPVHMTVPTISDIHDDRFWIVFAFLPRHKLTYMQSMLDECRQFADERDHCVDWRGGAAFLFQRKAATIQTSTSAPVR